MNSGPILTMLVLIVSAVVSQAFAVGEVGTLSASTPPQGEAAAKERIGSLGCDHDRRKAGIRAAIKRLVADGGSISELPKEISEYLGDASVPIADRYDIRSALLHLELSRAQNKTREDQLDHRARLARQLIAEFPTEDRAYSYFLQVAGFHSPAVSREMADEILRSSAPTKMKEAARRLVARGELLGKKLSVMGIELDSHKGRPLVIYTWSSKWAANLDVIKQLSKMDGVDFIAINLDPDTEVAKLKAETMAIPGVRIYEPQGLDGPLASTLHFTSRTSVYIVDKEGVLIDVNGHEGTFGKLSKMIETK